jgi:hypothetical protein
MRSRAVRGVLLAYLVGIVALMIVTVTDERHMAFSLAVRPAMPGVVVKPGHVACQRRIDVEESFDSITILPAAYYHPVPWLAVLVYDHGSPRPIAAAFLGSGHPENKVTPIRIRPPVRKGRYVDACFHNVGRWKVGLFSSGPNDNEPSYATLDGHVQAADILIEFQRPPRTALSLVPDIFRRAALFHPRWVGAWTFWVLLATLLLVVPGLLGLAVRAATRQPR